MASDNRLRCPLRRPEPAQRSRLLEIRDNLIDRITEAIREGWFGEVEGLEVSLAGAEVGSSGIRPETQPKRAPNTSIVRFSRGVRACPCGHRRRHQCVEHRHGSTAPPGASRVPRSCGRPRVWEDQQFAIPSRPPAAIQPHEPRPWSRATSSHHWGHGDRPSGSSALLTYWSWG